MMIRVFVGCAPNHEDIESQAVLEWSLRKHTKEDVEITWMKLSRNPHSAFYSQNGEGWRTEKWATPFSGFRWIMPDLCGFDGRAIYMDSDMIIMDDIANLWNQQFPLGKSVLAKAKGSWRYCVSLWDCKAVAPHMMLTEELMNNPSSHKIMSARFAGAPWVAPFEGNWNCLDGEQYSSLNDPDIKIIHYTAISTQPQLKYALPRLRRMRQKHWYDGQVKEHWRKDLISLFDNLLVEAITNGFSPDKYQDAPTFGDFRKLSLKNYRHGLRRS